MSNPLIERFRHHVSGAIERGEATAIEELAPSPFVLEPKAPSAQLQPVRWDWDVDESNPVYDGFTDVSTWNGWPNIWVTPETHAKVVADMIADDPMTSMDIQTVEDFRSLTPCTEGRGAGLISYGWGFTPRIVEEPAPAYRSQEEKYWIENEANRLAARARVPSLHKEDELE